MKICKLCEKNREICEYYLKKNGKPKSSYCKNCYNIVYKKEYDGEYYRKNKEIFKIKSREWCEKNDRSEYRKKYWEKNSENLKAKQKKFREENRELVSERKRRYLEKLTPEKKEQIRQRKRELYHKNNSKIRKAEYVKEKRNSDPLFKLRFNIRSLIRNSLKRGFTKKSKKTVDILGCDFLKFKEHLEAKFDDNMNWNNQGTYWHLDHIVPISSAKTEEDVIRLNHYTNFQPLYWLENIHKSDNY